jgi:hypothetical protein
VGTDSSTRINKLLADWCRANEEAPEALIPMVYNLVVSAAAVKREWVTARA